MKPKKTIKSAILSKRVRSKTPKIDIFFDKEITEIANFMAYVPYRVRVGQKKKAEGHMLIVQ
jgi:hypothetical protein